MYGSTASKRRTHPVRLQGRHSPFASLMLYGSGACVFIETRSMGFRGMTSEHVDFEYDCFFRDRFRRNHYWRLWKPVDVDCVITLVLSEVGCLESLKELKDNT